MILLLIQLITLINSVFHNSYSATFAFWGDNGLPPQLKCGKKNNVLLATSVMRACVCHDPMGGRPTCLWWPTSLWLMWASHKDASQRRLDKQFLGQFILSFFGAEPTVSTAVCIFHRIKVSHAAWPPERCVYKLRFHTLMFMILFLVVNLNLCDGCCANLWMNPFSSK